MDNMKIKVFIVFLLSFISSFFLIKNIFIANSPKIRQNIGAYFAMKAKNLFNKIYSLASLNNYRQFFNIPNNNTIKRNEEIKNKLKNKPLIPLGKGVYARIDGKDVLIEINLEGVDFVEYVFNIKGKEVKIKVPKGENPPPKEVVEKFYQ